MNTEQKKDPAIQLNQEDSMDIQGAGAFTLSCLKEELGKMEGMRTMWSGLVLPNFRHLYRKNRWSF